MAGVELVADRSSKATFDPARKVLGKVRTELEARGLCTRAVRDSLVLAPPLIVTEAQVDRIIGIMRDGIAAVVPERL